MDRLPPPEEIETLEALKERTGLKTQMFDDPEDVARIVGTDFMDQAVESLKKTRKGKGGAIGVKTFLTDKPGTSGLLQTFAFFRQRAINGFKLYMIKGDPEHVRTYRIRLRIELEGTAAVARVANGH